MFYQYKQLKNNTLHKIKTNKRINYQNITSSKTFFVARNNRLHNDQFYLILYAGRIVCLTV